MEEGLPDVIANFVHNSEDTKSNVADHLKDKEDARNKLE